MTEVVNIRFKNKGKVYFFDPAGNVVESGNFVVVETANGLEFGECTRGNHEVDDSRVILPLRPVVRLATEADVKTDEANKVKEAKAFETCQGKIAAHGLDMKLVDVEYSFDGDKVIFFFTSDGRVDFRDLVKDLAAVFRTRIELRQIGVRDGARMLGGLGICGRPFCCAEFLDNFQPVSIKMAKTQGLSLNPVKISGTCGRLMCCLKYEQDAYKDLTAQAPKSDSLVETPSGRGTVTDVNLIKRQFKVRLENSSDPALGVFSFDELDETKTHVTPIPKPAPLPEKKFIFNFDSTAEKPADEPVKKPAPEKKAPGSGSQPRRRGGRSGRQRKSGQQQPSSASKPSVPPRKKPGENN